MLFILAFVFILTVGAYFNYSGDYADEGLTARHGASAKQMVVYHAALARYCSDNDCTAPGSSVPASGLTPYLATYVGMPASYTNGTIRNVSTGEFVVTYYVGPDTVGAAKGMGTKGAVVAALYADTPNDTMTSVGVFDGVQMRSRGYVYQVGLETGAQTAGVRYPTVAVTAPGATTGTPMIASRVVTPTPAGPTGPVDCSKTPSNPSCY